MNREGKGLVELPEDKRDFQLGALYRLPNLEKLPDSFELKPLTIKNQGSTDFCSAYATCGLSELQEGVELYPEYTFALSKKISRDPESWGQDMRSAFKAHQKHGAVEVKDLPEATLQMGVDEQRYIDNYPIKFFDLAYKHRKKSFFNVSGPYDDFDNIRASIWKFRSEKQAVAVGLMFNWPLSQYVLSGLRAGGFGHMMYATGWTPEGLIVIQSAGLNAGKEGKHILTREVINANVGRFGKMMMVDISPEEAKKLLDRRSWYFASLFEKILIRLKRLL